MTRDGNKSMQTKKKRECVANTTCFFLRKRKIMKHMENNKLFASK